MSKIRQQLKRTAAAKPGTAVTLTLGQLVGASGALTRLLAHPVTAVLAFRLAKLGKAVSAEFEIYNSTRNKLLEQFGTLNKEKSEYNFTPENRIEFEKQLKELNGAEVVLPLAPVSVSDLQGIEISGADLLALEWLVQE
jgi:hypothetical protein